MALTLKDWVDIVKTSRALLGKAYFGDLVSSTDWRNRAHLFEDFAYICSKFYGCAELSKWVNALRKPSFKDIILPEDHNNCVEIAKQVRDCLSKCYNVSRLSSAISKLRTVSSGDYVLASDWNNLLDVADEIISLIELAYVLKVSVVDAYTKTAIPNAKVTANGITVYTNENGIAEIAGLEPETWITVKASATHYYEAQEKVFMDEVYKSLEIQLTPTEIECYTFYLAFVEDWESEPPAMALAFEETWESEPPPMTLVFVEDWEWE